MYSIMRILFAHGYKYIGKIIENIQVLCGEN